MSAIPTETIDRALQAVDAARRRHGPDNWDALADFGLNPAAFLTYARQHAALMAHGAAARDLVLDEGAFTTGWLDGLLCGAAIHAAHHGELP